MYNTAMACVLFGGNELPSAALIRPPMLGFESVMIYELADFKPKIG